MKPAVTIVDDCDELRFLLATLLEHELGLSCRSLGSLGEVIAHADDVLYSKVVILDINLGPGQPDGVAVYEWLREQGFPGRIFFLTGHAKNSPHVQQAASTGVPILEKPMTPDELIVMLEQATGVSPRAVL